MEWTQPEPDTYDQRIVLDGISWRQYVALSDARPPDARRPRMLYAGGSLEIMTTSKPHEYYKKLIARLLEAWADEVGETVEGYGGFTMQNAATSRGAEADECFYVGEAAKPVPDLAVEVIWTHGGLDRLDVYLGLGVREVWLWNEGELEVHVRQRGRFVRRDVSAVLPDLDLKLFRRCLREPTQTRAVRALRAGLARRRQH